MEDFGVKIDMDWEFDAPHWYDFGAEETENPDVWFDEQEAKMEKLANDLAHGAAVHLSKSKITTSVLPNQMYAKQEPSVRTSRKPTRIPVASRGSLRRTTRSMKSSSDMTGSRPSAIPVPRASKRHDVALDQEKFGSLSQIIEEDSGSKFTLRDKNAAMARTRSVLAFQSGSKQSRVPLQERVNQLN